MIPRGAGRAPPLADAKWFGAAPESDRRLLRAPDSLAGPLRSPTPPASRLPVRTAHAPRRAPSRPSPSGLDSGPLALDLRVRRGPRCRLRRGAREREVRAGRSLDRRAHRPRRPRRRPGGTPRPVRDHGRVQARSGRPAPHRLFRGCRPLPRPADGGGGIHGGGPQRTLHRRAPGRAARVGRLGERSGESTHRPRRRRSAGEHPSAERPWRRPRRRALEALRPRHGGAGHLRRRRGDGSAHEGGGVRAPGRRASGRSRPPAGPALRGARRHDEITRLALRPRSRAVPAPPRPRRARSCEERRRAPAHGRIAFVQADEGVVERHRPLREPARPDDARGGAFLQGAVGPERR